jgi:hypothetical protein
MCRYEQIYNIMYMKIEKGEVMHVVKNYSFAHFSGKLHLSVNHLYMCIVPDRETSVRRVSTWPYCL